MSKVRYAETIVRDIEDKDTASKYLESLFGEGSFTVNEVWATSNMANLQISWVTEKYTVHYNMHVNPVTDFTMLYNMFWDYGFAHFITLCSEKYSKTKKKTTDDRPMVLTSTPYLYDNWWKSSSIKQYLGE